ncbi:sulfurtransferase [Oleiharenicola lentus]|uniref:sulfurtransferase n=1 Tax=Oleiharenicola lentus TaxID=2508720 RepID=UPI003F6675B6
MKSFLKFAFPTTLAASAFAVSLAAKDVLVTTDWVAQNASKPNVRVIEVSVDPGLYEQGHIPDSFNVSWHNDLVDTVRRDIVSKKQFEALASRLGIKPDTTVVLYGDNNNWFAAWGAWIFNYYGHADVRLLDGGRKKWELEKRPYSPIPGNAPATHYAVTKVNTELRARLGDVVAVAEGKSETKLLDIRSPDEYSGKLFAPANSKELSVRAGHVPGAVNVPWAKAVNAEDGTFKSKAELKKIYAEAGVDGSKPVIAYCRIGERSSHSWFVLSQILDYSAKQYDGSWTEYGNAVGVPIDNPTGTVWNGK